MIGSDRSASRVAPNYLTDAFELVWMLLYFIFILEFGLLASFWMPKGLILVSSGGATILCQLT